MVDRAADLGRFRAIIYWTMGSLDATDPALLWFAIPVILLGSVAALTRAWTLNALELGEEGAIGFGVRLDTRLTDRVSFVTSGRIGGSEGISEFGVRGGLSYVLWQ